MRASCCTYTYIVVIGGQHDIGMVTSSGHHDKQRMMMIIAAVVVELDDDGNFNRHALNVVFIVRRRRPASLG